jgi:hypothetical protein
MIIKEFRNKTVARFVIITGVFLIVLGAAILSNKWVDNLFLSIFSTWKGQLPAPDWLDKLHLLGVDVLLAGMIVVSDWLVPSLWDRAASLKQNRFFLLIAPIGEIILIWLLITVNEFSFYYINNEVDVLPSAKQFVDRNWLPNDWYLNLDIGYRQPFNFIFGHLVSWLGFETGTYLGRLLFYLIFGIAIYIFFRALRLRFSFGLLALLLFLNQHSLIAGEWMVGGAETKTVAYAFVILAFTFFFRKRYLLGFASAGAAVSFHILVGCYALFCIAVATLLNRDWRSEWRLYLTHSWPFFITSYFGLQAAIKQLPPQGNVDATRAWEIYVQFRNPHHLLPTAWDGNLWIVILVLATGFFLIMYTIGKSNATRFVAAYASGSVLPFLFGLALYAWGETHLLRFYWFRFPDVMIMFMSAILIALILNDISYGRDIIHTLPHRLQTGLETILSGMAPIIIIYATILIILRSPYQLQAEFKYFQQNNTEPRMATLEWISENTPKQAIFLVDPAMSDFYIYAQRAMFVSWKHSPQSAADILEWYERIILCNGNRLPNKSGFNSLEELRTNFYNLHEAQIRQIANSYGISYYLGLPQQGLTFERVYSNSYFTVYKVNDTGKTNTSDK